MFQSPLPSQGDLDRYYATEYRPQYGEESLVERFADDEAEAHARVERLLPLRGGEGLLEVGSGSGAFLEAIKSQVGHAVGIEPEAAARQWLSARGNDVVDTLGAIGTRRFELIVMFHVLEHVLDPVSFLQHLAEHLAPNGRLIVEVPNVDDALLTVYQVPGFEAFYYQKAHLLYFARPSLAEAFRRAGLQVSITAIQRYGLGNHIHWMLERAPGGLGRYSNVLSADVEREYARSLAECGHADTLWGVGWAGT